MDKLAGLALAALLLLPLGGCDRGKAPVVEPPALDVDFLADDAAWRAERRQDLLRPDGWTSLVGLHWLAPGENRFGSDPALPVPMPAGTFGKAAILGTICAAAVLSAAIAAPATTRSGWPPAARSPSTSTPITTTRLRQRPSQLEKHHEPAPARHLPAVRQPALRHGP